MTVRDLMKVLMTYNLDLPVAYAKMSEYCLLEAEDLYVEAQGEARADGWVERKRPDKPTTLYLMFPGN
jgi:hypothetical protein